MDDKKRLDPSTAERPTRVRWLIFALACATSWLLYLHRYSWGVIRPYFKADHPNLDDEDVGWIDGAFNAPYAVGQVPGGLAGDVFGARAVLSVVILFWSLAVAGLAWVRTPWAAFGLRSLFGLVQAPAYPVLNKATRSWFPLSIRTTVQGVVTALGRFGGACAPAVVLSLLMHKLGLSWRDALVVIAAPGVLLAGAVWLVFRNNPREHPGVNPAELQVIEADGPPPSPSARPRLLLSGANLFNFGMMLLYAFASTFADAFFVNWITTFLKEGKELGDWETGLLAPLPLLGGAAGAAVGGVLNDLVLRRTGNRRLARSSVAFAGKFLAACLIAFAVQIPDGRTAMLVLLACKFFCDWSLPSQWGTITDVAGRGAATVFGVINTVGAVGGFLAGPVMGSLKKHYGWEGLFYGVAATFLVAALTWFFIDCTRRLVIEERV
jgi:sugar phosphate permease